MACGGCGSTHSSAIVRTLCWPAAVTICGAPSALSRQPREDSVPERKIMQTLAFAGASCAKKASRDFTRQIRPLRKALRRGEGGERSEPGEGISELQLKLIAPLTPTLPPRRSALPDLRIIDAELGQARVRGEGAQEPQTFICNCPALKGERERRRSAIANSGRSLHVTGNSSLGSPMSNQAVLLPLIVQVALTFAIGFWMAAKRVIAIRTRAVHRRDVSLREPNWPTHLMQLQNA